MVRLEESLLARLVAAKKHGDASNVVNSIDYSDDGTQLITAFGDDSVGIYDLKTGQRDKAQVNSKKYGVGIIRYTHNTNSAVHSSTKVDNTIRYLSLYDNKYLRYFVGHSAQVTALSMSPVDDMFLSASVDKTIRLWDLRTQSCQGLMQVSGRPVTSFDPEGLIFAAGIGSESVKLYDLRSFDKGPFNSFRIERDPSPAEWTSMVFSPEGKYILLNTNGEHLKLIDAFAGTLKHTLRGHSNTQKIELEAGFTPDSRHVCCGSTNGQVVMWNVDSGRDVIHLNTEQQVIKFTKWNPKYAMMATADSSVVFWLPPEDVDKQ